MRIDHKGRCLSRELDFILKQLRDLQLGCLFVEERQSGSWAFGRDWTGVGGRAATGGGPQKELVEGPRERIEDLRMGRGDRTCRLAAEKVLQLLEPSMCSEFHGASSGGSYPTRG